MRDPHVETLRYRLRLRDPAAQFNQPPATRFDTPNFTIDLQDEVATITFLEHFPDDHSARAAVEPVLSAWEAAAFLNQRTNIEFEFETAVVVDRDPPKGEIGSSMSDTVVAVKFTGGGVDEHLVGLYPAPPEGLGFNSDVAALVARYRNCRAGKEPITSCSYWILTKLMSRYGGGDQVVARAMNFSTKVFRELRRLQTVGDATIARKAGQGFVERPHTAAELAWLDGAIRALILRVAELEVTSPTSLPKVTLADILSH